jgi:hypothetical protein
MLLTATGLRDPAAADAALPPVMVSGGSATAISMLENTNVFPTEGHA